MGVNLGDEVGYTIRFEDHTTSVRLFLSHSCTLYTNFFYGLIMPQNLFCFVTTGCD